MPEANRGLDGLLEMLDQLDDAVVDRLPRSVWNGRTPPQPFQEFEEVGMVGGGCQAADLGAAIVSWDRPPG